MMFQLYYDQDYVYFTKQEAQEMAHEQLFDWLSRDCYYYLLDLLVDDLHCVPGEVTAPVTTAQRDENTKLWQAHFKQLHEAVADNDAEAVGRFILDAFNRRTVQPVIDEAVEEWEDRNNA